MGDYDYANARLRAMKSRLFDRRTYQELAALTRVDDLIARLAQSTYANAIEVALARYMGPRVVMEACRLHLAQTYRAIRAFFAADSARLLAVLLARWDLFNLKTTLRGHEARVRPEAILAALVPAGDLDESALRMLVRQSDPLAMVDMLWTWHAGYAQAVRDALPAFTRAHDWGEVESALDTSFYARLLASLESGAENDDLVRELLAREIDAANLLAVLRLRQADAMMGEVDIARYFIPGGDLSAAWLIELARAPRDEAALVALRASPFGAAIAGAEMLDPNAIQLALDRDLAHFGIGFFSRNPLTIATAIGFITATRVEVANVRLIAQGIALGMGWADIEQDLIVV
jgi:V/A-type H+-transporting ATPase subunit C